MMFIKFENDDGRWTLRIDDIDYFIIHERPWKRRVLKSLATMKFEEVPPEIYATVVLKKSEDDDLKATEEDRSHYLSSVEEAERFQAQLDQFCVGVGEHAEPLPPPPIVEGRSDRASSW